jgi:hypothetical protein
MSPESMLRAWSMLLVGMPLVLASTAAQAKASKAERSSPFR